MIEELYNKIDMFCNETDWSKYPTYEHALEEFIKEIVEEETKELEKENAELKAQLESERDLPAIAYMKKKNEEQLIKAKKIIEQLLLLPYANNEEVYADVTSYLDEAEQFLNSEVEK